MEKYGFIYLWYDRKHKRFYIGSHWGTENDGYICSSKWMRRSYRRRPEDFKRKIISIIRTTKIDLLAEEERWLGMIPDEQLGKRYYNLIKTASNLRWHADPAVRQVASQKSSSAQKGRKFTDEHRAKLSAAKKGKPSLRKGTKMTDEQRQHISIKTREAMARPGMKEMASANRRGIPAWNKGKELSERHRASLSIAQRKRFGTI